jgi:hypothetical protein
MRRLIPLLPLTSLLSLVVGVVVDSRVAVVEQGGIGVHVTGEDSGGGAPAESQLTLDLGTAYTVTVGDIGKGGNGVSSSITGSSVPRGGGGGVRLAIVPL